MFYFLDFHYQGRQVFFISSKVTVTFIEIISLSDVCWHDEIYFAFGHAEALANKNNKSIRPIDS